MSLEFCFYGGFWRLNNKKLYIIPIIKRFDENQLFELDTGFILNKNENKTDIKLTEKAQNTQKNILFKKIFFLYTTTHFLIIFVTNLWNETKN